MTSTQRTRGIPARALFPSSGSIVAGGTGQFELMCVMADGNPCLIRRFETLAEALASEADQQDAAKQAAAKHSAYRKHFFIVDRDNEERGSLSELDLVSCGGDYED